MSVTFSIEKRTIRGLDIIYTFFINFSCRQLASKTKTYYYHFDHLGSVSLADILVDKLFILKKMIGYHSTNGLGVCHGDEIFHLFRFVSL
jgi:hypothetical protein